MLLQVVYLALLLACVRAFDRPHRAVVFIGRANSHVIEARVLSCSHLDGWLGHLLLLQADIIVLLTLINCAAVLHGIRNLLVVTWPLHLSFLVAISRLLGRFLVHYTVAIVSSLLQLERVL